MQAHKYSMLIISMLIFFMLILRAKKAGISLKTGSDFSNHSTLASQRLFFINESVEPFGNCTTVY